MQDLTVIIITKNEEKNLLKCVRSLGELPKRIVVVDSGSTDRTCAVAKKLGCDLYFHEWPGYAAQINWAMDNTGIDTEWIMRMDADEELLPKLRDELETTLSFFEKTDKDRKHTDPECVNGFSLRRRIIFMGKWIRHGGVYPTYMLRVVRRGHAHCEQNIMDEHLVLTDGRAISLKNDFIDKNTKTLEWWTDKHNRYSDLELQNYLIGRDAVKKGCACKCSCKSEPERSKGKEQDINEQDIYEQCTNEQDTNVSPGLFGTQVERRRWLKNAFYYNTPLFLRARLYFIYRYYIRLGFLDGPEGRIFHFLQGYWYRFLVDAKIYEHDKKGRGNIDRSAQV